MNKEKRGIKEPGEMEEEKPREMELECDNKMGGGKEREGRKIVKEKKQ